MKVEEWDMGERRDQRTPGRAPMLCGLVVLFLLLGAVLPGVASALKAPFTLDPSRTLLEQYGYHPEYTQNVPAFDPQNRPFIRSRLASQDDTSFVHVLEQGAWVKHDFLEALKAAYPDFAGTINAGGWASDRIVFDPQGRAYTVLTIRLEEGQFRNVMLYSLDGCHDWGVVELPFGDAVPRYDYRNWGNVAMEHAAGANQLDGPPFLMFWRQTAPWKGVWASRHELYVTQPRFEGDSLVVPPLKLVTRNANSSIQVAGGSSYAATAGGATYFAYTEVAPLSATTSPTFVARYDQATGKVGPRVYVGGAKPANDSHNTPGLCIDSQGILHVVLGAHGYSFQYTRTVRPYDITSWTPKRPICTSGLRVAGTDRDGRGSQTYVSLVCDRDDTLHLLFRQSRKGVDGYLDGRRHGALSYQRKPARAGWSKPFVLVRTPSVYAQFYQKLSIDRLGRLFASLSYYTDSDPAATRAYRRYHHRMVLCSGDGGGTWRLATTADFAAGFAEAPPEIQPELRSGAPPEAQPELQP
jgi:hypothetical protein